MDENLKIKTKEHVECSCYKTCKNNECLCQLDRNKQTKKTSKNKIPEVL